VDAADVAPNRNDLPRCSLYRVDPFAYPLTEDRRNGNMMRALIDYPVTHLTTVACESDSGV
jgi:hypothetical protein